MNWVAVWIYLTIGWALAFNYNNWTIKHCPKEASDIVVIATATMWLPMIAGVVLSIPFTNYEKVCTK